MLNIFLQNASAQKYLIDTNCFITPSRFYYAFDIVPSYWAELLRAGTAGRVVLLDMVKSELFQKGDELSKWLQGNQDSFITCMHNTNEIIAQYTQVVNYIRNSADYSGRALKKWSKSSVADPWLIAAAKVNNYVITTFETPFKNQVKGQQQDNPKVPDVAKVFGVETSDLYDTMRQLGIRI
ncbi:MAG: DUF4411 family protein [Clostridia bacterium]|nr:DUF4411 family protein [Clostridia bacterium]